jgi:uncharacterized flavoprotein (TIGR03862 family)
METVDIAVIGGGPAGLRAVEVAAGMGRKVTVFDGKPSVGRKFLVAGKGGLNLTHGGSLERFVSNYNGGGDWECLLRDFSNHDLREWCHGLGLETFEASSGRVYPKALKGAPVLRAWLARLREMGVEIRPKHLWQDLLPGNTLRFADGAEVRAKSIVFALGGGSWPKTGSDGGWVEKFRKLGIGCELLVSSNCGWECDWPPEVLAAAEGLPIKNIHVRAGAKSVAGELLLTRYGLEGGAIYTLGSELRKMPEPFIEIDFKPTFSAEELAAKPIKFWKLSKPAAVLLSASRIEDPALLAKAAKGFRLPLLRPRPLSEAISSAGGIHWGELDENLMLRKIPGVFVCGEMIDWDAPTGGYLLQAAFATGTRAGKAAASF